MNLQPEQVIVIRAASRTIRTTPIADTGFTAHHYEDGDAGCFDFKDHDCGIYSFKLYKGWYVVKWGEREEEVNFDGEKHEGVDLTVLDGPFPDPVTATAVARLSGVV